MPIPLILGGAALLGTGALGVGGARVLKDELDMGVDAAAREELNQGKGKGGQEYRHSYPQMLAALRNSFIMYKELVLMIV